MKKAYEVTITSEHRKLISRIESLKSIEALGEKILKEMHGIGWANARAEIEIKELLAFGEWDGTKCTWATVEGGMREGVVKETAIVEASNAINLEDLGFKKVTMAGEMVRVAAKEIGVTEVGTSNTGVRVNQYKAATNLNPVAEWPWCAAFICWVVREAAEIVGLDKIKAWTRPTTAGAWAFETWANKQDGEFCNLKKPHLGDIRVGDIVCFTFSHIGLATSVPNSEGMVQTIEGNTDKKGGRDGGGVWVKHRHVSKIRSRIRLIPASAEVHYREETALFMGFKTAQAVVGK